MKSPLTGKEMVEMFEPMTVNHKGKQVDITFYYWLCVDTGEKFEDEQFAETNYLATVNKL